MEENITKHVCGVCNDEWLTEDEYNNHVCPNTNATPQQAEHLIKSTTPEFAAISEAALQRGLDSLQANGADDTQIAVQNEAIQQEAAQVPADQTISLQ